MPEGRIGKNAHNFKRNGPLVRRGENGQIDFFHRQMRQAMIDRCAKELEMRQKLHAAISDYLEGLPTDDPMIRLERMGQLIGQRNALRAARYYASLDVDPEPSTERIGSTWTLVDSIAIGESPGKENANLSWIASWLDAPALAAEEVHRLANNLQFRLLERMESEIALSARQRLIAAVQAALQHLATSDPANAGWQRDLSVSHIKVGDVLVAQGDLAGALRAYRESLESRQRLATSDPSNTGWQRDLSVSHGSVGDVLVAQGDLAGALRTYRATQTISQRLASSDPANAVWQRDLFVSKARLAQVSERGNPAEAREWWRMAYDQLSGMKQRGIMRLRDEKFLPILRQNAGL